MRETRKIYKICPRHTIRNLRNAPVQLSWERNLQMAATFPTTSPGTALPNNTRFTHYYKIPNTNQFYYYLI